MYSLTMFPVFTTIAEHICSFVKRIGIAKEYVYSAFPCGEMLTNLAQECPSVYSCISLFCVTIVEYTGSKLCQEKKGPIGS